MTGQRPIMLKEYLELDLDLESCSGFGCAPRRGDAASMRYLLEAELRGGSGAGGGRLVRARSKVALTKLSAVIQAVRLLPFGAFSSGCRSSHEGFLSRSFSKRLRGGFWKKKGKEEENEARVRVKDIVRLRSFEEEGEEMKSFQFPSPVVSSCSSWSETCSSGSEFLRSSIGSSESLGEIDAGGNGDGDGDGKKESPPRRSPSLKRSPKGGMAVGGDSVSVETATGHREPKSERMECPGCQSEEEKEQLSPVSVMDFPYEDEEEESSPSPSFQQSLANVERTKLQLLQRIRRFESVAELAVDLEDRFLSFEDQTESSDHVASDVGEEAERATVEARAWDLLLDLKASAQVGPRGCVEKLLVDFFIERLSSSDGVDRSRPLRTRGASGACEPEEILKAASEWISGEGSWEVEEFPRVAEVKEMERNGRWRCFDEEEEELAVDLVDIMLGTLVGELVLDLVS